MRIAAACLLLAALAVSGAHAQPYGPLLEHFPPKSGKPAPVVVLLSGASGTTNYRYYGTDVSELGYYAVLVDGNAILSRVVDGEWNLRQVIANAQGSPNALPSSLASGSWLLPSKVSSWRSSSRPRVARLRSCGSDCSTAA